MDALFVEMVDSLREGQTAIDRELQPLLQARDPDWSMLMRLRDVADEYAQRSRALRGMMIGKGVEADSIEEVDRLCKFFDGTADLIAQETGDKDRSATPLEDDEAGWG